MVYIGIDPGKQGAVAFYNDEVSKLVVYPTPLLGNEYDILKMYEYIYLTTSNLDSFAVLERAQAMPKQGVVSMFEFGRGYGIWLTILTVLKIPFQVVHPRVWTNELLKGSPGKDKERAVIMASRLYGWRPEKKKEWNLADAILLVEYARRLKKK